MKGFPIAPMKLGRNLLALFLVSAPVLYLGAILAVSIHEIIGHGLMAQILGGRLKGFGIGLDGMGWADVGVKGFSAQRMVAMYLGGAVGTTLCALAFFALGKAFRKNALARLVFCLLGFVFMLDGLPYYFWDAIFLGGIGDFSMVSNIYAGSALRIGTIALSGLLMAAMIALFNAWYYRIAIRFVGEAKPASMKSKIAASLMIFLQQACCWFVFDWNQLVPGVGILPSATGTAAAAITLLYMIFSAERVEKEESIASKWSLKSLLIVLWAACAVTIICIALWLQKGIALPV
jgi:hypothetical protein